VRVLKGTAVVYGLMPGLNAAKLNGIEALDVYAPLGWATLFVWALLEFLQKVLSRTARLALLRLM
jgi:hypothetical protein